MKLLPNRKILSETIGYILIGVVGTVIDMSIFFALKSLMPLVVAQWTGALAGTLHNQLWHHYKLFTHKKSFWQTLSPVLLLMVVTIVASGPLLVLLHRFIDSLFVCKILLIGVMGGINFILRKFWIFQ